MHLAGALERMTDMQTLDLVGHMCACACSCQAAGGYLTWAGPPKARCSIFINKLQPREC
jgi:hypothetical protein